MTHIDTEIQPSQLARIVPSDTVNVLLLVIAGFVLGWIVAIAPPLPEGQSSNGGLEVWHGNVRASQP